MTEPMVRFEHSGSALAVVMKLMKHPVLCGPSHVIGGHSGAVIRPQRAAESPNTALVADAERFLSSPLSSLSCAWPPWVSSKRLKEGFGVSRVSSRGI